MRPQASRLVPHLVAGRLLIGAPELIDRGAEVSQKAEAAIGLLWVVLRSVVYGVGERGQRIDDIFHPTELAGSRVRWGGRRRVLALVRHRAASYGHGRRRQWDRDRRDWIRLRRPGILGWVGARLFGLHNRCFHNGCRAL